MPNDTPALGTVAVGSSPRGRRKRGEGVSAYAVLLMWHRAFACSRHELAMVDNGDTTAAVAAAAVLLPQFDMKVDPHSPPPLLLRDRTILSEIYRTIVLKPR